MSEREHTPQDQASQDPHARLEDRPFEELYELAGKLGIASRNEMTRAELIEAIRRR